MNSKQCPLCDSRTIEDVCKCGFVFEVVALEEEPKPKAKKKDKEEVIPDAT